MRSQKGGGHLEVIRGSSLMDGLPERGIIGPHRVNKSLD